MARGTTKRQRYEATFHQAAQILLTGREVILRPESGEDMRTIMNYWYHWRTVYWGFLSKSPDTEKARQAGVMLDCRISPDTDDNGRLCLRIRPRITPKAMIVEAVAPVGTTTALSTGHGSSVPSATNAEASHYEQHTKPWEEWFDAATDMDGMLDCLNWLTSKLSVPSASLDDLPPPNSPEAAALKGQLREWLRSIGKAKP